MNDTVKKYRFSLRTLLAGVGVFCVALCLLRVLVWPLILPFTSGYWEEVSDRYALMQTEEMLSLYTVTNSGQVPVNWEQLRNEFKILNQSYGNPGLSSLKDRVLIDFSALQEATLVDSQQRMGTTSPIVRLVSRKKEGFVKLTPQEKRSNSRIRDSIEHFLVNGSSASGEKIEPHDTSNH